MKNRQARNPVYIKERKNLSQCGRGVYNFIQSVQGGLISNIVFELKQEATECARPLEK